VFNLGGVLGGFIPFISNFNSDGRTVNNGTYIAYVAIMLLGSIFALVLKPPAKVARTDGSLVVLLKAQTQCRKLYKC
jgi:hypothetical protein